jgi:hypothetical protein
MVYVSEEHIASIFTAEEETKEKSSRNLVAYILKRI